MVKFMMAGQRVDAQNQLLNKWLTVPELKDKLFLLGEYKNIPAFMTVLDFFCLTSKSEAFPNVIGEAMACGVPCIATDVGDSKLIIGESGRIILRSDPEELANVIEEMMELNEDEKAYLSRKARKRIIKHFSLPIIAREYEESYKRLITGTMIGY